MSTKFSNWLSKKDKTSMKPAGCFDGIFQLFDRQHLLSGRQLNGPEDEKNHSGQALLSLTKQEANHKDLSYLEKNLSSSYQENSKSSSMESSSPTSFSPSFKSFSSLEHKSPRVKLRCSEQSSLPGSPPTSTPRPRSPDVKSNKLLKPIDSPRPVFDLSKLKDLEESLRILIKLKKLPKDFHEVGSPRFSYETFREEKGIKHAVKQREHRRLSLDSMEDSKRRDFNSKFNSLVEDLKRNTNHRVSESSTLLQDLERNESYPSIVAKLMGLEPISPAKKNTIKASDHKNKQGKSLQSPPPTSPKSHRSIYHNMKFNSSTRLVIEEGSMKQKTGSIHSVKEKMLQKLQFQHNSKEISRKSSGDWNFRNAKSKSEEMSISERDLCSPIMAMKSVSKSDYTSSTKFSKPYGLSGLRKIRTSDSNNRKKEPFIVDGEQTPTGNTPNTLLKSTSKETSRRAGNSNAVSPKFQNRKPVIPSCDLKNTQRQSSRNRQQLESVSTIGRIKQKPSETRGNEVKSHLFQQTKGNTLTNTTSSAKHKQHQMIPREVLCTKELDKVAAPQPSPNSVLDTSPYSDDSSLSPLSVSSISDDHNLKFADLPLTLHSNLCFGADSQKSDTMGTITDQFIVLGSTIDEPSLTNYDPDNKYVAKLLLESGFLSKNPVQPSENGENNNTQRLHRQLVYDVVNEILARKKEAFSSGLIKHDKFSSPYLLKELRSEIKCLQSSKDGILQDKDPVFTADLLRRSKAWDRFESEVPVVVLETEKLIFADLIDEIVSSLSAVVLKCRERHRKQLFA